MAFFLRKRGHFFVWFLSTAPAETLTTISEYRISDGRVPKNLGKIAINVAVTHALNDRKTGCVALYADEKGGGSLVDWYIRCGMEVLSANLRLPRVPRQLFKPSDGRYCQLLHKKR